MRSSTLLETIPFAGLVTLSVCLIALSALCAAGARVLVRGSSRKARAYGIALGVVALGLLAAGVAVGVICLTA